MDKIITSRYNSPCGELLLGSYGDRLCMCDWRSGRHHDIVSGRLRRMLHTGFEDGLSDVIEMAIMQLEGYFAGKRRIFDVPLLFAGTDFQKRVWYELSVVPYGRTISYGELATMIGMPKAVRAVANANAANAISIFAPCHRVIGADRSLTGYGGGLDAKKYLLNLERQPETCCRLQEEHPNGYQKL